MLNKLFGDDEKEAENQLEEKKYAGEVHLFYLDTENEIVRVLDRARVLIDSSLTSERRSVWPI